MLFNPLRFRRASNYHRFGPMLPRRKSATHHGTSPDFNRAAPQPRPRLALRFLDSNRLAVIRTPPAVTGLVFEFEYDT
jgi:hypothetical protein